MSRTTFDPETKVWSAPEKPYTFGSQTIGEVVYAALDRKPDAVVEVHHDTGRLVTRREMKEMSVSMAQHFLDLGVEPNDVIVILLENRFYSGALLLASTYITAPFCALELKLDRNTLRNLLYQLQPKIIVCEQTEHQQVKSIVAELNLNHCTVFVDSEEDGPDSVTKLFTSEKDLSNFKPLPIDDIENTVACIVSSSATTGTYKLISLSHPMLLHN